MGASVKEKWGLEGEVKWSDSRSVLSDSLRPHGGYSPGTSPGQNTGVGSLSLLQGIFPTQESNRKRKFILEIHVAEQTFMVSGGVWVSVCVCVSGFFF